MPALSFSPARLAELLLASLADRHPGGDQASSAAGLCVALSGGLDSTVLLVALAEARQASRLLLPLRALHVDHGLHPESAAWIESCRRLAAASSIPFESVRIDARAGRGESPEAAARAARYAALSARLLPGEVLLTAHHADDQLETVLLQWLRGGGLQALAGMPALARFGVDAWHARPLLPFTRQELLAWAQSRHLRWAEDPSNADVRFDRNYLRSEVLPALRRRWPAAAQTVARVARYATDGVEAEQTVAVQDLAECAVGATLDLARLRGLSDARQRAVLRAWFRVLGLPLPSARSLAVLRRDALIAASDRNPAIDWPGAVVHRYRNRLYASPREEGDWSTGAWAAETRERFILSPQSSLAWQPTQGTGLSASRLPRSVRVGRRVGGEHFIPAGGAHRRPLRKWFQERGVLPWRRDEVPLIFAGDTLIAIGDLACAEEYAARDGESSLRIVWQGRGVVTETDAKQFDWREHPPIR